MEARVQLAASMMVGTSISLETADVAAALVECPEYCFVSIPACLSVALIHLLIVDDETGLWGSCEPIKSLESCLSCLVLAIYCLICHSA